MRWQANQKDRTLLVLLLVQLELAPHLLDGLREVDVDPSVVDYRVLHLKISLFAGLRHLELDERVLQRSPRLPVLDDLAAPDLPEPREDQLQVLVRRGRVQLAHKQNVIRRGDVSVRDVL